MFDQARDFARRGAIVDEISEDNQTRGIVVAQQFFEAILDRLHSPKWKKIPSGALAQFVSKMKVGYREPAFSLMKESKAPIEENVFANGNLTR